MRRRLQRGVVVGLVALLGGRSGAAGPLRVLPLGDSITEGVDAAGSYRSWLWRELEAAGVEADFVGTLSGVREGAAEGFDADHEGRWGWRTDQVAGIAERVVRETRPDVVLVHLGHNDLWQGEETGEVLADLEEVVEALRRGQPGVTVVLSTLVPSAMEGLQGTAEVNAGLPGLAERLGVELADGAAGFDPSEMTVDGVHPNETGARHLAAAWNTALRPLVGPGTLPTVPDSPPNPVSLHARPGYRSEPVPDGGLHADRLPLATHPSEAWKVTRQLLVSWPRTKLEAEGPGYLRFSEKRRWLGFVDDLELVLDEDSGAIDVRSRSRFGPWDLGANRRRVERLRRRLASFGMVEPG